MGYDPAAPKRATNVTLNEQLLAEARALEINISRAAEQGLAKAIADKRAEQWLRENKEAIDGWNEWVEKNGLPLDRYRQF
jgi:antitoxin CcdA